MNPKRPARPALTVSVAFLLALGASGVAASAVYADSSPTPAGTSTSTEASEPTFTLVSNSPGNFELTLTVPGTSIAVTYAVDALGAVTTATTSSVGASVVADGDELTITLADGRIIEVELGKSGTTVDEIEVDEPDEDGDDEGDDRHDDSTDDSTDDDADAATADTDDADHSVADSDDSDDAGTPDADDDNGDDESSTGATSSDSDSDSDD